MKRDAFNVFCASLPATTNVVQWGGASVWKVGGKIFAICSDWGADGQESDDTHGSNYVSFKCSDLSYQILCELPDITPAPYLARAKWVQLQSRAALSDEDTRSYIKDAHALIASKLTKKKQKELGLLPQ